MCIRAFDRKTNLNRMPAAQLKRISIKHSNFPYFFLFTFLFWLSNSHYIFIKCFQLNAMKTKRKNAIHSYAKHIQQIGYLFYIVIRERCRAAVVSTENGKWDDVSIRFDSIGIELTA